MTLNLNTAALATLEEVSELQRLRLAFLGADTAVYDWTLADDNIQWSDNTPSVLGAEAFGHVSSGEGLRSTIDQRYGGLIDRAIAASAVSGDPFRVEYPLSLGAGSTIWVEDSGICLRDQKGQASRIIGSIRNITDRKVMEDRLVYLASYDELTGQFNRTVLRDALGEVVAQSKETAERSCYLLIGIDHLAVINEDYGFEIADEVILAVSQRVSGFLREGDILGRAGGNKFGVVLVDCGPGEAEEICRAILLSVRSSVVRTAKGPAAVTVSIGGVHLPDGAANAGEAMSRAEEALGHAKQFGRDSLRFHNPSIRVESIRKQNITMADEIVRALEEDRILVAYQPIICAETGETTLYECLARMKTPDDEIVAAGQWVPIAERLGLIRQIDRRIAEVALEVLSDNPGVSLGLNVSAATATDSEWLEVFLTMVKDVPHIASRLTVELTETLALQDLEESSRFVSRLRDAGCQVAIDDFGAGYTSFKNLQRLAVDMVKIDGAFISGIESNPDNQLFVRTLISLAQNFDSATVAEWVDSEAAADLLRNLGVDYLQGFLYGQPLIHPPFMKKR